MYPSESEFQKRLSLYEKVLCAETGDHFIKPKRDKVIRAAYGNTWHIQWECHKEMRNIQMSHLIGMNEIGVPVMVEEYARLREFTKLLEEGLKKLKPIKEIVILDDIVAVTKAKIWGDVLYKDLEHIQNVYGLDLDIKHYMTQYKQYSLPNEEVKRIKGNETN